MHDLGGGFSVQENVVLTSTNPTGGVGAWTKSYLGPASYMSALDCPTTGFCLIVDEWGQAWSSTNPTGGAGAWSSEFIDSDEFLVDVACPTASFCAAVDETGHALNSNSPSGGLAAWASSNVPNLTDLSCPSTVLCIGSGLQAVSVGTPNPPDEPGTGSGVPTGATIGGGSSPGGSISLPTISRLFVRAGKVNVPVICRGMTSCNGGIKLLAPTATGSQKKRRQARAAQVKIGGIGFSIPQNLRKKVAVPLNRRGRHLFAHRRRVVARLLIDGRVNGRIVKLSKTVTLKVKR
jgi:hypothetical protein